MRIKIRYQIGNDEINTRFIGMHLAKENINATGLEQWINTTSFIGSMTYANGTTHTFIQ